MTAGLPGTGVGGMFYLLSALVMPLREVYGRARGRSTSGGWRAVFLQAGLALGILAGMWAAGWLLGAGVAAVHAALPARSAGAPPSGNVLRTVALVVSLGTLAAVLLGVELLGLWLGRRAPGPPDEPDESHPEEIEMPKRSAAAGRRGVLLAVAGLMTAQAPPLAAQTSSPAHAHLARAESAYAAGEPDVAEREYAAVLEVDPENSRATYRLGELRRRDPAQALRLFRRYVELEPSDPWGYMAVGDVLSRSGQHEAALVWYDAALRLAPGERDAVVGRARVLARRAQEAPALEPTVLGSQDSDGSTVLRFLAALDAAAGGTRLGATFSRTRTGDRLASATVDETAFQARGPPHTGWSVSATVGAARLDAPAVYSNGSPGPPPRDSTPGPPPQDTTPGRPPQDTTPGTPGPKPVAPIPGGAQSRRVTVVATGLLRARWRPPTGGAAVDLRLKRDVLVATPLLVTNGVIRTELHGMVDLPLARAVKLRGTGRATLLKDRDHENRRTGWGGAIAFPVGRTQMSLQFHQAGFARPSTAGYFAPRLAQTVEAETYVEIETARSVSIALTVAAGVQRVARQGAPPSPWRRAFRLHALTVVPLAPGRALQLELEGEDSSGGSLIATSERWRYGSAAVGVRWAM